MAPKIQYFIDISMFEYPFHHIWHIYIHLLTITCYQEYCHTNMLSWLSYNHPSLESQYPEKEGFAVESECAGKCNTMLSSSNARFYKKEYICELMKYQ